LHKTKYRQREAKLKQREKKRFEYKTLTNKYIIKYYKH